MGKRVRIEIHNGKVDMDYSGFEGRSCSTLNQAIQPDGVEIDEQSYKNGGSECEVEHDTHGE